MPTKLGPVASELSAWPHARTSCCGGATGPNQLQPARPAHKAKSGAPGKWAARRSACLQACSGHSSPSTLSSDLPRTHAYRGVARAWLDSRLLSSHAREGHPGLLRLSSTYCWQGVRVSTASALLRPRLQGMKAVEASFAGLVAAWAGLGNQACCSSATSAFQLVPSCAYFCT